MTVGTLGNVVFYIRKNAVKTIKALAWKKSYSYVTHKLYGKKGLLEYTGTDPEEIELEAEFSAFLGVNPLTATNSISKMAASKKVVQLILGNDVIGTKWVITGLEIKSDRFFQDGTILSVAVKIKIKEYAEE